MREPQGSDQSAEGRLPLRRPPPGPHNGFAMLDAANQIGDEEDDEEGGEAET